MVFEVFSNWMRGNRTERNSKVKILPVKIIVDYWWQIPNGCLLLQGPTFCHFKWFEHWCLYRNKLICKCFECQSHLFCPALKDKALYGNGIHFVSFLKWNWCPLQNFVVFVIGINQQFVLSEKLQRLRWKSWFRLQQSQSGMPELKFVSRFWLALTLSLPCTHATYKICDVCWFWFSF